MIDEKLDIYSKLITGYAQVAMKKLKKPANHTLNDLIQEGVVIFLNTKKLYKKDRGASFKTFLIRRLRNHFADMVKQSYRISNITNHVSWDKFQDIDFSEKRIFDDKKGSIDTFEIVQISSFIESLTYSELEYVKTILSFIHIRRRSRRKIVREALKISYDRERELRRSLKDKLRK